MFTIDSMAASSTKHAVEPSEELLTVREVARILRIDDTTVRRWIKYGTLDAIPLPSSGIRQAYRVRKSTIDALFERHTSHN